MALGKELKAELEYGKLAYADGAKLGDKFYRFTLSGKTGAWNWEGNYINIDNLLKLGGQDDKIWTLGARVNLDKAYASAMYLKSDVNVADKDAGYVWVSVMPVPDRMRLAAGVSGANIIISLLGQISCIRCRECILRLVLKAGDLVPIILLPEI